MRNPAQLDGAPATTDWRHEGRCRKADPELFFPTGKPGPQLAARIARAKAVCTGCPSVDPCLKWALETREVEGVWGGRAPIERAALLAELDAAGLPAEVTS